MKDVNGIEIEVGMTVETTQPSGGVFNPAPSTTGEVVIYDLSDKKELAIKYNKTYQGKDINCYILLNGKINEVL